MLVKFQPNKKVKTGDCVIRALCKALDKSWLEVFDDITPVSREMQVPCNYKDCYDKYLRQKGFTYRSVSVKKGEKRPRVNDFANEHPDKVCVLRLSGHLVTTMNGNYYDIWDCGNKCVYCYWEKEM